MRNNFQPWTDISNCNLQQIAISKQIFNQSSLMRIKYLEAYFQILKLPISYKNVNIKRHHLIVAKK